ncbi:MAG TPA: hypothetical protein VL053_08495 [Arachidicoccus sp.]|nr:hypothetical protein [Arachidicoccus sp.]
MKDHIKDLLISYQCSEEIKEQAAFRVIFSRESPNQVMEELNIQNAYTINNWVKAYKLKIEAALVTFPPIILAGKP